ncbi:MAG: hypothetical protein Q9M20_04240 [Mariprofundaceae bacterium]|nr:hypothetical protein [Mariprofundaceae bacterium]
MTFDCETLNRETRNNLDMLQWMSERNTHVPISELAFLIDIPENEYLHQSMANFDYPYEP